ncbi:LytTR family transcriptional regulator DNA-binding domain-containing protein [Bernardetia sp. OM2101]|uniref:LytTR family transcriptional regulator DNA-binding domain-containing protein n=1 Tax=Bernardetia sp. OM2101 TaxID=3344876 RepID=UPI0035D046D4
MPQKVISTYWFFIYYTISALAVVHIGNDNTFSELLDNPSYYTDLIFALVLSYLCGLYLYLFYKKLNTTHFHRQELSHRIKKQFLMGVTFPLVVIISTEILYLIYLLDIPLHKSSIFYLELPLVFIFLFLANAAYFINFELKNRNEFLTDNLEKKLEQELENNLKIKVKQETKKITEELIYKIETDLKAKLEQELEEKKNQIPSYFVVNRGHDFIKIPVEEIAFFELSEKIIYLTTFEGNRFYQKEKLQHFFSLLSPQNFYQLNRQIIAHRKSIIGYEATTTRKIKIHFSPKSLEEQFVAKANVSKFLEWYQV